MRKLSEDPSPSSTSAAAAGQAEEAKDSSDNLLGEITVGLKNQPSPRMGEGDETIDSTPTPTSDT